MRIREIALVLPVATLLAGSAAPAHACSPAFPRPASAMTSPYATHSPAGSCIHAAILTLQDRRVFHDATHVGQALEVITAHRHEMCMALVDYLKQAAA